MALTFVQLSARHRCATTWLSMKSHVVMRRFGDDAMSGIKYEIVVPANTSYLLPARNADTGNQTRNQG